MSEYPREIILDHPKLKKLLLEKNDMVLAGRELSADIEELEAEMELIDKEIQKQEAKAEVADLKEKANELSDKMGVLVKEMEEVKKTLYERARLEVDEKLISDYENKKSSRKKKRSRGANSPSKLARKTTGSSPYLGN